MRTALVNQRNYDYALKAFSGLYMKRPDLKEMLAGAYHRWLVREREAGR